MVTLLDAISSALCFTSIFSFEWGSIGCHCWLSVWRILAIMKFASFRPMVACFQKGMDFTNVWRMICSFLGKIVHFLWSFTIWRSRQQNEKHTKHMYRVAVIGGGIAGCGAVYALAKHTNNNKKKKFEVVLYETKSTVGGNAKTCEWKEGQYGQVTTGLSVLAWPKENYFRNYKALLKQLGIETTNVELPFMVRDLRDTKQQVFAHEKITDTSVVFDKDLKKWSRMVKIVRRAGAFLVGDEPSLYHRSLLNPFNYIPLRALALIFGISNTFWETVVVPIYSSSFLTVHLNFIPSVILPVLDDLISLQPDRTPVMESWIDNSANVFDKMLAFPGVTVRCNRTVDCIKPLKMSNGHVVYYVDQDEERYDFVILACNASGASAMLKKGGAGDSLLVRLLAHITYSDDDDDSWAKGIIHRDANILPCQFKIELQKRYANLVDIYSVAGKTIYHNHFILSSWYPALEVFARQSNRCRTDIEPMFVTYAGRERPCQIDSLKYVGELVNKKAHPHFNLRNIGLAWLLSFWQGSNGLYFCGSYSTPANGHDLSLLSGFSAAFELGAEYPFGDNDQPALRDFHRIRRLLGYKDQKRSRKSCFTDV